MGDDQRKERGALFKKLDYLSQVSIIFIHHFPLICQQNRLPQHPEQPF
mgnify:CR=1 FL=1